MALFPAGRAPVKSQTVAQQGRAGSSGSFILILLFSAPPLTIGGCKKSPSKNMKNSSIIRVLTLAAFAFGGALSVQAQATRTWVSGVGDDANPCSRTAPCKTFAGAISKTADKGEISVLDPGGFGVVTITKNITLNGTGTLAGILSAGSPSAVTVNDVNAPSPNSSVVILRDISMNGAGTGTSGVRYLSGGSVMLDHCWIYGMTSRGIDINKTLSGRLKVIDTVIENVGEDGIHMTTTAQRIRATIDRTRIMNCGQDGIEADSNVLGTITNSTVSQTGGIGIRTSGTGCTVDIDDTSVSLNSVGIQAAPGSSLQLSDCVIIQNGTGLSINGGTIDSFQGNSLMANTAPGAFSSTTNKQ
jgi:hypothetical protein